MKNPMMNLGERIALLLEKKMEGQKKSLVVKEIAALSAGRKSEVRKFYAKKMALCVTVLFLGGILALLCALLPGMGSREVENQTLLRPEYGEGDRTEELTVKAGEEEVGPLQVTVQSRKYTDEEKQALLEEAVEELERVLPGENDSLDEVRKSLVFPETLARGAVQASWTTFPYGILDEKGKPGEITEEEGVVAEIQAALTCQGEEAVYTAHARVYPPVLTEKEALIQSIQKEAARADEEGSHEMTLSLPEEAAGRSLVWYRPQQDPVSSVLAMTAVAVLCIYVQMDQQVHKKAEARRNQLLLDYPDLMWKMTMLLGAGLTMKGTFARIVQEYEKSRERACRIRYVYEEMAYTCHEMSSGIPEAEAYERFGKRCQLPEYIRLGSVLSQNLKKGSRGLTELLEKEASDSMNQRKNQAKKIGERAGTRLLLPMMLMLGIVLAILMIPAFLSF